MTCPSDAELARALSLATSSADPGASGARGAGASATAGASGARGAGASATAGAASRSPAPVGAGDPRVRDGLGGGSPRGDAFPGVAPALAAHLAACPTCRAAWDDTRAVIDLARELPVASPPPARREELRTTLLAAAELAAEAPPRRLRPRWAAAAVIASGAVAAASVIGYVARPDHAPGTHAHGTVHPRPGARYLASGGGPDEIVWLIDGALDIEVAPLHPGERYRVVVGGAEVEVRGTAFTVGARGNHLLDVAVGHGRVEVRPELGPPATLGTGQAWHASVVRAVSARSPAPAPAPAASASARAAGIAATSPAGLVASAPSARARAKGRPPAAQAIVAPSSPIAQAAPDPAAPVAGRAPAEVSYDEAWEALRGNDFVRASRSFARVLLLSPDSPLVEDASFWRAVALARGNRGAEACAGFRDLLDTFPRSARAGEASAMLGWLLIDARAYDEAAARFRAALADPHPAVHRSAQAGLDALAGRAR